MPRWLALAALATMTAVAACAGVQQRFPDDVQQSLAQRPMRRAETDHFIIYYPAGRGDELARFVQHAERCVDALRGAAVLKDGPWRDKMVVVMPEVAFDNAFVVPDLEGYEAVALIPSVNTLDFATEFGLPPDPGYIACHELTHYTHDKQIAGFWRVVDAIFGDLYSPQIGFDPWFFEGLATHYETALNPGVGRPTWPIFTGMFAAAYAGERHLSSGELSQYGRLASVGHHYLVGTMFVRFLAETFGDHALWQSIASQASSISGLLFPIAFQSGTSRSFGALFDQFDAWVHRTFPERHAPASQRALGAIGNDARYARGRDGTEAWVADDVDLPPRLVVRDARGAELADLGLVDIVPPRTLVQADPLLVSGLSVTADGGEVWLTVIDYAGTAQIPRLLRWRRGDGKVTEVARDLGPGATISPRGDVYYYCAVDGDRWSLAAYDVASGTHRTIRDMPAGTYILGAQISPDGAQLVTNTFDRGFFAEVVDAHTGAVTRTIRTDTPIYDASFLADGRVMWLGEIDHRFQVVVENQPVTDAPYAALAPREANGTIRFLDREGWQWTLAEVATPPDSGSLAPRHGTPPPPEPEPRAITAIDQPYCPWEHFFYPQQRSPTVLYVSSGAPHLGVVLGGGDRLDEQRWSLAGYAQPPSSGSTAWHYAGDVAYLNHMLAPVTIYADVDAIDWVDPVTFANGSAAPPDHRRERDATLQILRTWRGTFTAAVAGLYTDDFDQLVTPERRHLGGPQITLAYGAAESTRYTGPRRALYASVNAAYYPSAISTFTGDLTDVGGALGAVVPMPWGRRHTLAIGVRGRALLASDDRDTELLQLGGDTGLATLFSGTNSSTVPPGFDSSRFPPNLRFIEQLRGYEDFAIPTDRTEIVDVDYRYPLIVDRGWAASLWWFPASYLRELDLELFGDGALDKANQQHAAVGVAVTARVAIWRIPLLITYQLARRVRDDDAVVQLVGIGPDQ
jgi:hypothetical protein|nr:hypothetical protein [Kofleriaceae bacterium]